MEQMINQYRTMVVHTAHAREESGSIPSAGITIHKVNYLGGLILSPSFVSSDLLCESSGMQRGFIHITLFSPLLQHPDGFNQNLTPQIPFCANLRYYR